MILVSPSRLCSLRAAVTPFLAKTADRDSWGSGVSPSQITGVAETSSTAWTPGVGEYPAVPVILRLSDIISRPPPMEAFPRWRIDAADARKARLPTPLADRE